MDTKPDLGAEGEQDTAPAAPPQPASEQGGKNIVVLSADHFPEGAAVKDGDVLQFHVTGQPDSEGNVSGYFEGAGAADEKEETWEDMVRREMSPTAKENSA
jgi:hypothetical protein